MGREIQLKKPLFSMTINVVGIEESGEWTATALELDIAGTGKNFNAAVKDMLDAVGVQIAFAIEKGLMDSLYHPAPPMYWQIFERNRANAMSAAVSGKAQSGNVRLGSVPLDNLVAAHQAKKAFSRVRAAA